MDILFAMLAILVLILGPLALMGWLADKLAQWFPESD